MHVVGRNDTPCLKIGVAGIEIGQNFITGRGVRIAHAPNIALDSQDFQPSQRIASRPGCPAHRDASPPAITELNCRANCHGWPRSMNHQSLSAFIWSVADLLRGDYKQSEDGRVILPLTVLCRLDCVLEAPLCRQRTVAPSNSWRGCRRLWGNDRTDPCPSPFRDAKEYHTPSPQSPSSTALVRSPPDSRRSDSPTL